MKFHESEEYIHCCSPYWALAFRKDRPFIGHLGVESGGRLRKHMDCNLLVPGEGAGLRGAGSSTWQVERKGKSVVYKQDDSGAVIAFRFTGERKLTVEIDAALVASGFEFCYAPAVAPPTVWADPKKFPPYPNPKKGRSQNGVLPKLDNDYGLPLKWHFPGYGMLSVKSTTEVLCKESFVPSKEQTGLNLGYANAGYHTIAKAYHHGKLRYRFKSQDVTKPLVLQLQVDDEVQPDVIKALADDSRFDGLRRCWGNSFTLDKHSLTMGDNILLGGIGHLAVHFKSDLLPYTPDLGVAYGPHQALRRALDLTFRHCVSDAGDINWAYGNDGLAKDQKLTDGFTDCPASNLIALHNYLRSTDDWSLVEEDEEKICRVGRYLIGLDEDGDGIVELPFHGNFLEDPRTRNWWDNIAFGHKDAYFNLLVHRALRHLQEILAKRGQDEVCREIAVFLKKMDKAFHATFFNPETEVYAGWISQDGRMHDYRFTFVTSMAINEGLVTRKVGRKALKKMLKEMERLGYDGRYGVPGNLMPLAPEDTIDWDVLGAWGVYENGGLCGQAAYHFIQALYEMGMRDDADRILFAMLATFEREDTHSGVFPGYAKSVDWRTKEGIGCGYNYLADNYYFLLAAITGFLGEHGRTLTDTD